MTTLSTQKTKLNVQAKTQSQDIYQALENWNTYSAQSIQNMRTLVEAYTPFKDCAQIMTQLMERAGRTWQLEEVMNYSWGQGALNKKTVDMNKFLEAYYELLNIHAASLNLLAQDNNQYLQASLDTGVQAIQSANISNVNPQEAVAASINMSIQMMQRYQDVVNNQFQHLSSIQSAYSAWFQKTFFNQA